MRSRLFDLVGVLSILAFAAVLVADLDELRLPGGEMPLAVSAQDRASGFREGEAWYAYVLAEAEEQKVGYARVERRIVGDERRLRIDSLLRPTVLGRTTEVTLELEALLDEYMALESVRLDASTGGFELHAAGRVRDSRLELELSGGGLHHQSTIPLEQPITLELGARPMLLATQPRVGQRFIVPTFDPMSMRVAETQIEYRGREEIEVLDQSINAHVLSQNVRGETVRVWVNDLGEVLREEMPLGIVAERVSEADASWGFGAGGAEISAVMEQLPELMPVLGSAFPFARPTAGPTPQPEGPP